MDKQKAADRYTPAEYGSPMNPKGVLRQYFLGRLGVEAIVALRDVTGCSHLEAADFLSGDMADVDSLRDSVNENARVKRWEELCNFYEDAKEFALWFQGVKDEDSARVTEELKELQRKLSYVLPESPLVKECDPELERLLAEEDEIAQCPECGLKDAHTILCNEGIVARCDELVSRR